MKIDGPWSSHLTDQPVYLNGQAPELVRDTVSRHGVEGLSRWSILLPEEFGKGGEAVGRDT